jgi:hypothetical protein
MKKQMVFVISFLIVVFAMTTVMANTDIMVFKKGDKKVHFAIKDRQKVNSCAFCHNGTGIMKDATKKNSQGFRGKGSNYSKLGKDKKFARCAGSGCHQ